MLQTLHMSQNSSYIQLLLVTATLWTLCLEHVKGQCGLWPLTPNRQGGRRGGDFPHSQMGNWRMLTERPLYPAVVVDETQPLHCHISYMTPAEQDFAWRGGEGGTKSKCVGRERVKGNRVTMMERKRQRREAQIWHIYTILPENTTI